MKKKILSKILMVAMTASIFLTGCGEQKESQEDTAQNTEVVQEVDESVEQGSLFSGTIFDNLVMGETTKTDVEKLLEDRILEYEYVHVDNAIYSMSGKTTITDVFGEWNALYKYILVGSGEREDYKLTDWTVELLLNEDAEYKDAVKYIQSTIDANTLEGYTTIEDNYSDDMVQGDVVYYPIEKFTMNDVDGIKYIMFGKYANCDTEEAKHIIVLSIGIVAEEDYQKGKIEKIPTFEIQPIEGIEIQEVKPVTENEEIEKYQNVAFFFTDLLPTETARCKSASIVSINSLTSGIKIVNVPGALYLNIGDDKYNRYAHAYGDGGAEQAIRALNTNMDMNIQDFIAIDLKSLSEFVDALGGIWIDVPREIGAAATNEQLMSILGTEEPFVINEGLQLLNGNQVATYAYWYGNGYGAEQIIIAIGKQMQNMDTETVNQVINTYFVPKIYTSLDAEEVNVLMKMLSEDNVIDEANFPQEDMRENVKMSSVGSCVTPIDLEANVIWLHQFLFGQENYEVSSTVKDYSAEIKDKVEKYKAE
ncbi:MAG: LCP family protein [Lachnospiraceae bacterium]|nr:LCP family protein [Lachnospiraceae bacterium]